MEGQAIAPQQLTPEKVIGAVWRQAEVELTQGKRVGEVRRGLGISEQNYYRWRSEYGGLKLEQARRMKDLEKENGRLKKAVAELTLDLNEDDYLAHKASLLKSGLTLKPNQNPFVNALL